MSLTHIRPYFTNRLMSLGFTEWDDAFHDDNIPSTIMDRAFFQTLVGVVGETTTSLDVELVATVEIRCFFKGFRNPVSALNDAIDRSQEVIKTCVNTLNQSGTDIKGVYFQTLGLEPLNLDANDNVVKAVLVFDARVYLCTDNA